MLPLPIDSLLPELTHALKSAGALVLQAPPGAGKTTRVPWALLEAGFARQGEILVAEPRRLAARLAARHVAQEHGQDVGGTVGYSVRFEQATSARTRICYLTEGVLLRRSLAAPTLPQAAVVVLDEFHERHLATDLCLAWVRHLHRTRRPDLKLVVMSATLDASEVADYLGGCPCLRSEGRCYPVSIEHLPRPDQRPLHQQIISATRQVLRQGPAGDILVFLPGAAEIRRARAALASLGEAESLAILPLHGDLPLAEQAAAVTPADQRKLVLSTNVAESSVTIDGVAAVVDSGLARIALHSPWSGLPRLTTAPISRAAATQRAGRAGRTRAGRVLRLYTRGDHDRRPERDPPEVLRADLAETRLILSCAELDGEPSFTWLTEPPAAALASAANLLRQLGAFDDAEKTTALGRRMLQFPLHPRLARMVVAGEHRGVSEQACLAAALVAERDIRASARTCFGTVRRSDAGGPSGPSDVLELIDRFEEGRAASFDPGRLRSYGLDVRAMRAVRGAHRQLSRQARNAASPPASANDVETAVCQCVLAGFVDRVARRRKAGGRELILATGETARLAESSVVHHAPLLVAVDVEQRAAGGSRGTTVRLASAIEGEWLLDRYPELLESTDELIWNVAAEQVERVSRIGCGSVVLEESRSRAPPSAQASQLLARVARAAGIAAFPQQEDLEQLAARLELLRQHYQEASWPDPDGTSLDAALEAASTGLTSFAELRAAGITQQLQQQLSSQQQRQLREATPERLTLPGGRSVKVHYERGKPPWIASRLQDFFGMSAPPTIAAGRATLTVHLLAPSQRAVQVTTDLAGFWQRHYPRIRRELMRRYPKHAWPENGATAAPPQSRSPRR